MKLGKFVVLPILAIGLLYSALSLSAGAKMVPAEGTVILTDNNTVNLNMPISGDSAKAVQQKLLAKSRKLNRRDPIYLFLNSPGGSISSGNEIIELAQGLPQKVHTITLFSASMAFIISQSLEDRLILRNGEMMSHRAFASGLSGNVPGSLLTRANALEKGLAEIDEEVAKRAGLETAKYQDMIKDELWMSSRTTRKLNFSDKTVKVFCDKSLDGTESTTVQVLIFTVTVKFHKCPLITEPVSIEMDAPERRKQNPTYQIEQDPQYAEAKRILDDLFHDKASFVKKYVVQGGLEQSFR